MKKKKSLHDSSNGPLLKIWCAVHRSNLAYKDVANSVSEVKLITADVVSVGSYFHVSGVQTHGLKEAAEASGLSEPLHWPDFKEVRLPNLLINYLQCYYRSRICY